MCHVLMRYANLDFLRYPARVFPGDTLCYVTGMAFAVVGIQAHFSKTLLLFFMPQIFNFLLSCPQLFVLVPCPRHRVPRFAGLLPRDNFRLNIVLYPIDRFDKETNMLYPSLAVPNADPAGKTFAKNPSRLTLRVLSALKLTEVTRDPATGIITNTTNLTILNFLLLRLGPMNERSLVKVLIAAQVCSAFSYY